MDNEGTICCSISITNTTDIIKVVQKHKTFYKNDWPLVWGRIDTCTSFKQTFKPCNIITLIRNTK